MGANHHSADNRWPSDGPATSRREGSDGGESTWEAVASQMSTETHEFVRSLFVRAALAGLERNGSPEDAKWARPYLEDVLKKELAIRVLARLGNTSDVVSLTRVAKDGYGTAQSLAATAALHLSQNSSEVVEEFLRSGDKFLVNLALTTLSDAEPTVWKVRLLPLLNDENGSTRQL